MTSCASLASRPLEYLHEATAATIMAANKPLVFARQRPELASHARDYATLLAVDINRSGRHEQWLLLYLSSTVDPRLVPVHSPAPDSFVLRADDRALRFEREADAPAESKTAWPVQIAGPHSAPAMYRTDRATLAFIAGSSRLVLEVVPQADAGAFELWSDGRSSLGELARHPGM